MKDGTAQRTITPGQVKELTVALAQAIPLDLPFNVAELWIGNKGILSEKVVKLLSGIPLEIKEKEIILDWKRFWKKYLNAKIDLSQVQIPFYQGFDRVIIVPKGITEDRVFQVCSKKFRIGKWTDKNLSEVIDHNDRIPTETYAIRVRDRQEADEENKNISAEKAKEESINGITLLERLIYGLKYWDETGKHLDMDNSTICSGSRYSDGDVPHVYCYDDEVYVNWSHPQHANSHWRVRTVVSC